jgi:hypothetical protein
MANNLTGDFDVIAQFAIPAINRILAAMHQAQRFPHSLAMRVDDTTTSPDMGTAISVIDAFGDAVADHKAIRNPRPVNLGAILGNKMESALARGFDPIANASALSALLNPLQPSNLKGRAFLQLFPPTVELTDPSARNATIKMELMARYIPDPETPRVAEFIRGDIRITAPISQVTSLSQRVITMDIKSANVQVAFTPQWSSTPIDPQDIAAINLVIRNALKTSFLPSSARLPDEIASVQFKMVPGPHGSVAMLIDMNGAPGNPATANQTLVSGADGFVFAVGGDYLQEKFAPIVTSILQEQIAPIRKTVDYYFSSYSVTYTVTLNHAELQLKQGKMALVIKGHAHTGTWFLPDFNFTATQDMTLAPSGDTVELILGDFNFDPDSTIMDAIFWLASANLGSARDQAFAKSNARSMVRVAFSANANIGGFLKSLLTPASGTAPGGPVAIDLRYTAAAISPDGVTLHGSVDVSAWPPARAEYEQVTHVSDGSRLDDLFHHGKDYSAFKSWIPGGTIRSYEWKREDQVQGYVDDHTFILKSLSPAISVGIADGLITASSPMCLTVRGDRLSAKGPVKTEPVTATICGYRRFPLDDFAVDGGGAVVLASSGDDGNVDPIGRAAPLSGGSDNTRPNLLVRIVGDGPSADVDQLIKAMEDGGRADAATAILVVTPASEIRRTRYNQGITYIEDDGKSASRLGLHTDGHPVTALISPEGKIVWQKTGRVDEAELGRVLKEKLSDSSATGSAVATGGLRIGHVAPNFLIGVDSGQQVTLRKLSGRKATLVFDHDQKGYRVSVDPGSSDDSKQREAQTIVVDDRDGSITRAYGISIWPTAVMLDESGVIRSVAYGKPGSRNRSKTANGSAL